MAKMTITICDVKPCNRPAEREFEFNGQTICVCGENCFVKYWSREYQSWKSSPYFMQAFPDQPVAFRSCEKNVEAHLDRQLLQVVKPL